MNLRALVAASVLLLPASTSTFSQDDKGASVPFWDGNNLYEICTSPKGSPKMSLCLAYVMGASDAFQFARVICPPKELTNGQTVDVVVKLLRDHPETRHSSAPSEVATALMRAFPCKEQAH